MKCPDEPWDHTKVHGFKLEECKNKLLNATSDLQDTESPGIPSEDSLVDELFRLAALTYLEQCTYSFPVQTGELDIWISKAFKLLETLESCHWPFLLLIFACEARNDYRRHIIMSLIERAEEDDPMKTMLRIKTMIHFIWAQEDFGTWEMGYHEKITMILSISDTIPTFV